MATYTHLGTGDAVVEEIELTLTLADCEVSDTAKEVITYSEPGTLAAVVANAPELGSKLSSDYAPTTSTAYYLYSLNFKSTGEGLTWRVVATYGEIEGTDDDDDDATDTKTYSLNTIAQTRSILLHPRYAGNVTGYELQIIKAILDGKTAWDYLVKDGTQVKAATEDTSGAKQIGELAENFSTLGAELYQKIIAGTTSYESYAYEWSETEYASSVSELSKLGKTGTPSGNGVPSGKSWLLCGISAEKSSGEKWKKTVKWKSADEGATWDSALYSS